MKSLFIIGNGFDYYAHKMKTKYMDFREYLVRKYPECDTDFDGLLYSSMQPDGGEEYDMDEVVGSIIRTIDECSAPEWNDLEECLGKSFISNIAYDNEWAFKETDIEDDEDDEIFHSIYENEDLSNAIIGAYAILHRLFVEWVYEELANIDYSDYRKLIRTPSIKNAGFLNFNYTETLEKMYGILPEQVCHIHGSVYGREEDIYFGHGDDEEFNGFIQYWGIDEAFNSLKKQLRKNTNNALCDNIDFFKSLADVKKIYSYGFSFSDVDMIYVEEIKKNIKSKRVKWYFNKYDWDNNKEYIKKIKALGFKVRVTRKWKQAK